MGGISSVVGRNKEQHCCISPSIFLYDFHPIGREEEEEVLEIDQPAKRALTLIALDERIIIAEPESSCDG
eukprot:5724356-Ditylum_brightwellii.AAC.1